MNRLGLAVALGLTAGAATAERLRIATFDTELARRGPGLLLRDLTSGKDAQVAAVVAVIVATHPDVLALQGIDWDHDGAALAALADLLKVAGVDYPHRFALRPNTGMATGLDLDGDGLTGGPGDAQGFGAFTGEGGMAILSRLPIETAAVQDFSALLWRDFPDAQLPQHPDGTPFPFEAALAVQRLSSSGHWVVPLILPDGGRLNFLTFNAGPPVFDGPEDRNGRRNHDEIAFWRHWLDGAFGAVPDGAVVIAGNANLDPFDSEGRGEAIRLLLDDPRLVDPEPSSPGAAAAPDQGHRGNNALDTVDWPEPGRLRVDYLLPSRSLTVLGSGVYWPAPGEPGHEAALAASRHRLVWVDLGLD